MKKLFNYALLAAALLVGVNVNAVDVCSVTIGEGQPTNYSSVKAALDAIDQDQTTDVATIDMIEDALETTDLFFENDRTYVWNFNGKTVTIGLGAQCGLHIDNADVTLNGAGTLQASTEMGRHYLVLVHGSTDPTVSEFSTVTVDKGLKITTAEKEAYAFDIIYRLKKNGDKIDGNENAAYGVTVNFKDCHVYGYYGAIAVIGSLIGNGENRPVVNVSKDAELEANDKCTAITGGDITAAAKYYAKRYLSDESKYTEKAAQDWAAAYKESSAAIYGAGVATWNIYGYVHGGNGLYIKGGNVVINGARVSATAPEYHEPILKESGYIASGSAIILDTNAGYAGPDGITISNSTVTSDNGYAIEEVVTKEGANTGIPDIVVESGTFVGGLGAITTTEGARQKIQDEKSITGGEWHNTNINQYLSQGYTTLDFVDGDGKSYQVVVKVGASGWQTIAQAATKETGDKFAYVQADETVSAGKTTVEFVRIADGKTVTVASGATLDAGTLMTEKTGKIIVEAGGTLIVSGNQGAYTFDENSLVVGTSEANPGIVLINPAVELNTTPKATVKFISKSYYTSNLDYQFQYFGTPMVGEVKSIKPDKNVETSIELWNTASWEWNSLGILKADGTGLSTPINAPFGFYNMIVNSPESAGKVTYTITGNLIGKTTHEINLPDKWNAMANSYSGKIGAQALLDALKSESNLGKSIYVYTKQGKYLIWRAANELSLSKDLAPMAAFMLVNNTADNKVISLDYNNLVWTPATTPAKAPKASQFAKATINVNSEIMGDAVTIAEDAMFSTDFEDGYDAEKFDNQAIKFYVNADGEYDIYATDNLNNTFIGLMTTEAGKYTISFEDVTGNFDLVDTKTNARIAMAEGTTYEFLAEAGEDAYRFMIVEAAKAPTNNEKVPAAIKANKALINNQIIINNGERFFNMLGTDVK